MTLTGDILRKYRAMRLWKWIVAVAVLALVGIWQGVSTNVVIPVLGTLASATSHVATRWLSVAMVISRGDYLLALLAASFVVLLGAVVDKAKAESKINDSARAEAETQAEKKYAKGLSRQKRFLELDERVFLMLVNLQKQSDPAGRIKKIIRDILNEEISAIGQRVKRAHILIKDPSNPTRLMSWGGVEVNMTAESMSHSFEITPPSPDRRRGVAVCSFCDQKLIVVHFDANGKADHDEYVLSTHGTPRQYDSFINVPIRHAGECLGVMCFDSPDRDVFDDEDVQTYLEVLGTRVAVIMSIGIQLASRDAATPLPEPGKTQVAKGTPAVSGGTARHSRKRTNTSSPPWKQQ